MRAGSSNDELEWFLRRAAEVRASPRFENERAERSAFAARLRELLEAAERADALRPSLRRLAALKYWPSHLGDQVEGWATSDEQSLRQALLVFVNGQGLGAEERFRRFAEAVKAACAGGHLEWSPSIVLRFGSMLNFALAPDSLPLTQGHGFGQMEQTLGYVPREGKTIVEQYEHHIAFARYLTAALTRASVPVRDMIDVQTCVSLSMRAAPGLLPRLPRDRSIQILEDEEWIMSLGERAAIEGLVSQVGPRLALEIGAGLGGSLKRLAAHSGEVHEIDLMAPPAFVEELGNVHWHMGDSHELLPRLLHQFSNEGRNVDFVLVDGDHTEAGVRRDMQDLLSSPAVGRTVIVAHDTMNESVRAGLEQVDYERIAKVAYVELDFVPGYMVREPSRRYQLWGGLGLIVVDQDSREMVRQDRYYEAHSLLLAAKALTIEREASNEIPAS